MIISLNLAYFILASLCLVVSNELIKRRFSLPVYLTRKIAHFGAALIAFLSPFFLNLREIILISIIFAIVLFLTRRTSFFSSIHGVKRNTLGEVFLPIGVLLCALFFLPQDIKSFQFGILIMGVSDGLAGLIGEGFGKHYFKLFNSRKSIEGTCIFFITSLALTYLFVSGFDYRILVVSLFLTIVEFFLEYGLDNLALPILGACLIHFLM
jgi:dolichol kinase